MTDREYEKHKKRIQIVLDKWVPILQLQRDRLKVEFIREYFTDKYTIALCTPLWEYRSHIIKFYLPSIADVSDEELEDDVVHELCHILLAPASGNDAPENKHLASQVELATQNVAFALIDAYRKGKEAE